MFGLLTAIVEAKSGAAGGPSFTEILLRTLRSPSQMAQILRSQRQLAACDYVPLGVRLRGRAFVENRGRIEIGPRVRIDARTVPVELVCGPGATLSIGEGTFLNYGVSISAHSEVAIGKRCLIGNYVNVMDSDYHDVIDHTLPGKSAPVIIEDDVWIGTRVIVLKGVRIGRASVVGAGSVVTTDIPPNCLAFGVPAQIVRKIGTDMNNG
jgi:acetyltransferase-like isoleucine patch superfamily enzyme